MCGAREGHQLELLSSVEMEQPDAEVFDDGMWGLDDTALAFLEQSGGLDFQFEASAGLGSLEQNWRCLEQSHGASCNWRDSVD